MTYQNKQIADVAQKLQKEFEELDDKSKILKSNQLKALYTQIPLLDPSERSTFGKELNQLKGQLQAQVEKTTQHNVVIEPIDVTAPFAENTPVNLRPRLLTQDKGSKHPLTVETEHIIDIFTRMGFEAVESRQLDDEFHMFSSLNFPEGHPARDDYDTFITTDGLIAPAHTSTMQNRVLRSKTPPIRYVIPGRVFRNEDLDATHEHTFYQLEGVYVDKDINVGHLIATLKTFLEEYFQEEIEVRTQPFYFPFTEPSFEYAIKRPGKDWLEILGCGLIHPNVLTQGGIDPKKYSGFAWGFGIDRLVMMKYGIEDVRHFESAKLDFLRQF
ncbi:MAG: phenylalanine--tRNA ligase subunit alpha [Candidatus Nomurabacteria bacterium]|nr:MAG: phenylalanine--tRNA ligase subunit alpha [Candidatus Nomurabacteria bacterium]